MSQGQSASAARQAGVGVFWLTMAKFYFMGTGLVLLLFLPALFKKFAGEQHVAVYGDYRTVAGLLNWFNMVLVGGTLQAVSKFVSEKETRARSVKWETLKIQTVVGGGAALLLFFGADLIATRFYDDPSLAIYLRLAAPIVLLYSWYAVIIGCLNGLKRFFHQAGMDMLFATSKVALTIVLVALGYSISGAIGGFLITAAVMLAISWVVLGKAPAGERVSWRTIFNFEWKTLLFAFFLNGMLQVDLQLLKALAPERLGPASDQTGIYGAALQVGQLPYIAIISVAFVIFPLLSKATFEKETGKVQEYVRTTNRYVLLFLAGIVAPVVLEGQNILTVVYPDEYAAGAAIFSLLATSYFFFAGMVVSANMLTAAGRPMTTAVIFGASLGLSTLLCVLFIPMWGGMGAAAGVCIAMAVGAVVFGWTCHRQFGAYMPLMSPIRTLLALVPVILLGHFVLSGGWGFAGLLLRLALLFAVYVTMLFVLREMTVDELKNLASLRRKMA